MTTDEFLQSHYTPPKPMQYMLILFAGQLSVGLSLLFCPP